jgi:hypothetical protein
LKHALDDSHDALSLSTNSKTHEQHPSAQASSRDAGDLDKCTEP